MLKWFYDRLHEKYGGAVVKGNENQAGNMPLVFPATGGGFSQVGLADSAGTQELLKGYHTWVYRAVRIIAENAAKQRLGLYIMKDGGREAIAEHPLLEALKNPNPVQTRFDLWELTWTYLELTGNSYWYKAKDGLGVTRELWPIRPDLMQPVPDEKEILKGYLWQFRGKKIAFGVEEIVHLMYPNPLSMWIGTGSLEAARYIYDTDLFMRRWNIGTFKNMARPDGVLETDAYLQGDDIMRARESWQKVYGGVDNAHKIAILQSGLKYKQLSMSPHDLDFLESIKASKIDVYEMFGVPRSIAGIIEDVNRANAEAENFVFAERTLLPKFCKMQERLTKSLAREVDDRLFFEFDNPVPEDKEFKLKERESDLKHFVTSINEEREKRGFEAAEWGNGPWMPFNLVQFGSSFSDTDPAKNIEAKADKRNIIFNEDYRLASWKAFEQVAQSTERAFRRSLRKLFDEQKAVVLKNLSAVKSHKASEATIEAVLFDLEAWEKIFRQNMDKQFSAAVIAGARKAIDDIAAGTAFDINSPLVQAFLEDKVFKFSFEVNDTTIKSLRQTLTAGLDADETITELTTRVESIFGFADNTRSKRIALTEVNTSTNFGIHDAYRQSGIVEKKNWLSQRDGTVRDSHAIDDEVILLSETFSNGLLYPGDSSGDPAEIINCRCTTLPVIE